MIEWLVSNKEWIFSGIGVTIVASVARLLWNVKANRVPHEINNKQSTVQIVHIASTGTPTVKQSRDTADLTAENRSSVRILFIDDDRRFRVVKILQQEGWVHTRIVGDLRSLEQPEVQEADILFVDVQGVGRQLGFNNEGLGLALALKKRHSKKKVVIYSAQTSGERFDEALRKADDFLAKNADPYEFITIVERLARTLL